MLTSLLRFIFTTPQNIKELMCNHLWEYYFNDPSDFHTTKECRKCGKIDSEFK